MMEKQKQFAAEAVEIEFADGRKFELRYSLGSARRLKKKLGASLFTGEALKEIDEDKLPELLYEGIIDKAAVTPEQFAEMCTLPMVPYLVRKFVEAWSGSLPEAPEKNG